MVRYNVLISYEHESTTLSTMKVSTLRNEMQSSIKEGGTWLFVKLQVGPGVIKVSPFHGEDEIAPTRVSWALACFVRLLLGRLPGLTQLVWESLWGFRWSTFPQCLISQWR